jgi:hypothetical protein
MNFCSTARVALLALVALIASASAAAADSGIKFGPTFTKFSSDALDFNNRTGWHGGIFFGGKQSGPIGLQSEVNWIRKQAEVGTGGQNIRIDYLQLPILLRINASALYGIAGPAVDIKIADEIEGVTLDDGFEGADVSLVFGGGIEVARFIVEGRYTKGLRRINKLFGDFTEIKTQSFTLLFGVRFN